MTIGPVLMAAMDRPDEIPAALAGRARLVVFDLRPVAAAALPSARLAAAEAVRAAAALPRPPRTLVAVHALETELVEADLAAVCLSRPDGVLLPRTETGADLQHLGAMLAVEEARAGLDDGAIGIVALAETGSSLFGLIGLAAASPRLRAIAWDGEALARDLGSEIAREADGRWTDPCQTARTLALAACADARLPAIDSSFSTADRDAFAREAERARRDGFSGKLCLGAAQVEIADAAFSDRQAGRFSVNVSKTVE